MTNTLRPLTVGELLDRTFFLYRRHFLLFVGIAALPNLIILSFQLFQLVMAPRSLGGAVMTLAWLIVTMIVYFVTIAISQGATIIAVSQIQLQREATASGAFAAIRPRIGEIALVILGMGLRILVGFLFFIVPGVYLAIVWSLTIPVVVLASIVFGLPLVLGLEPKDIAMLAVTLLVSSVTLSTGRTYMMQGAVHLVLFAAFLFLALVP